MTALSALLDRFGESEASDLHLTAGGAPYLRLHGEIVPLENFPAVNAEDLEKLTRELVGEEAFTRFLRENELDVAADYRGDRLRINLYRQQGAIAWSLRRLPAGFFPLEDLGLPPAVTDLACTLRHGLVLVTGATGSGKSTTLASIINEINATRRCHIFTIEDPVEYLHRNLKAFVSQREVGSDTASFAEALRRVLREDPDVVLIGEMRDLTTIRAALTLAETGHLTFGTLHTASAVDTVTRLIGAFPANEQDEIRVQLAATLSLIICQQLIPWSRGGGRSLAAETLVATPAVRALIRENKVHQLGSVIQTGQQLGMRTMNMSLNALYAAGMVDAARALEWSPNREEMRNLLGFRQ